MSDTEFWQQIVRAILIVMDAICKRHGISVRSALERRL